MFLNPLVRRNLGLVKAAVDLHQSGLLPANTVVLDLDAIATNAGSISREAARLGLTVFAMTKQIGRNPDACHAIRAGGIIASVAVDMADARATTASGLALGHLGHLVQVPAAETAAAAGWQPQNWTVFSDEKARGAAEASRRLGNDQQLLARIWGPGDEFYSGHEGGFRAEDVVAVADRLDALPGAHFGGITTFPALLFDRATGRIRATQNLKTLENAARALRSAGRTLVEVNAPGTTSTVTLAALAGAGATQVEPGHGLTGTTPLHAVTDDLPEVPAICYLTEVSHLAGGRAYCFGGGMYVDPVFPPYPIRALAGADSEALTLVDADLPPATAIDYYGQLRTEARSLREGESVVFGFRMQAFVTRAYTAGVSGISSGVPRVEGVWTAAGLPATWR
jgi:predicted amino acid racemase